MQNLRFLSQDFDGEHGGGQHEEEENLFSELNFLFFLILTWLYVFLAGWMEHNHISFMHITGLGIIIGFLIGMILHFASGGEFGHSNLEFDEKFFFHVILPPIIFAGGYNLQTRRFFYNFYYVALFGVLATLINFTITSVLTFVFSDQGYIEVQGGKVIQLENSDILLYSATICSSDAIAALTMIDSNKFPKLFSVIFGEGMVNDAVAIIIYMTVFDIVVVQEGQEQKELGWVAPFEIIGMFLLIVFSSIAIGIFFGALSALITKHCRFVSENPILEVSTIFLLGYIGYIICELCGFSGVIAILICGIFMNHYTSKNLSITGKISSKVTLEFIALVSEGFLYMYIGISSWYFEGPFNTSSELADRPWSWQFLLFELFVTFFARFCGIFILSWIVIGIKKIRGRNNWAINRWEMSIIYFGGIVRGAIAYALIQTLPGENLSQEVVKATVFFIVVITTVGLGSFTPFWIKFSIKRIEINTKKYHAQHPSIMDPLAPKTEIETQNNLEESLNKGEQSSNENNIDEGDDDNEKDVKNKKKTQINRKTKKMEGIFGNIDKRVFLPFFVFEYAKNYKEMKADEKAMRKVIKRGFNFQKQDDDDDEDKLSTAKTENQYNNDLLVRSSLAVPFNNNRLSCFNDEVQDKLKNKLRSQTSNLGQNNNNTNNMSKINQNGSLLSAVNESGITQMTDSSFLDLKSEKKTDLQINLVQQKDKEDEQIQQQKENNENNSGKIAKGNQSPQGIQIEMEDLNKQSDFLEQLKKSCHENEELEEKLQTNEEVEENEQKVEN